MEIERSTISDGVSPEAVSQYEEQEVGTLFLGSDAVFMCNVPRFFALSSDPAPSSVEQEQSRSPELQLSGRLKPLHERQRQGPGHRLRVHPLHERPRAAQVPLDKGLRPPDAPEELYEDEEILREVRVAELGQEAIKNTRPRPVSPFYSDMPLRTAAQFV